MAKVLAAELRRNGRPITDDLIWVIWTVLRRRKERQYDSPMAGFVLLHSPLVGPSTWKWVAEELRSLGNDVDVPVISPSSTSQGWEGVVGEVLTQLPVASNLVFVAHSGAGPLLPTIVDRSNARAATLVFVDAGVPAMDVSTPLLPPELFRHLAPTAQDGLLPPWSEWFGPDVISSLVPDAEKRELVGSEVSRLPLDYFSGLVPPVRSWPTERNGYVLLSDGYLEGAFEARRRGWPVVELLGQHLDLVTKAPDVARAILEVISAG